VQAPCKDREADLAKAGAVTDCTIRRDAYTADMPNARAQNIADERTLVPAHTVHDQKVVRSQTIQRLPVDVIRTPRVRHVFSRRKEPNSHGSANHTFASADRKYGHETLHATSRDSGLVQLTAGGACAHALQLLQDLVCDPNCGCLPHCHGYVLSLFRNQRWLR
jgi:hypothetical protein